MNLLPATAGTKRVGMWYNSFLSSPLSRMV